MRPVGIYPHYNYDTNKFCKDKINQWGEDFRDGYTRLGLLKPFMALHAAVYFFTATATAEDIKVYFKIMEIILCWVFI